MLPPKPWGAPTDAPLFDRARARQKVTWDVAYMLAVTLATFTVLEFAVFHWWLDKVYEQPLPLWVPCVSVVVLALVSWQRERAFRRWQQVDAVRARLRPRHAPVWRTVVQMNDGTQVRFDTTMRLSVGDFVETDISGQLAPANLLGQARPVVGVVVSCEAQLLPPVVPQNRTVRH